MVQEFFGLLEGLAGGKGKTDRIGGIPLAFPYCKEDLGDRLALGATGAYARDVDPFVRKGPTTTLAFFFVREKLNRYGEPSRGELIWICGFFERDS